MGGRRLALDAFASHHNAVCESFFSRGLEVGCAGVDATACYPRIAQIAHGGFIWAFPPFSLIYGFVAACAAHDMHACLVHPLMPNTAQDQFMRDRLEIPLRLRLAQGQAHSQNPSSGSAFVAGRFYPPGTQVTPRLPMCVSVILGRRKGGTDRQDC